MKKEKKASHGGIEKIKSAAEEIQRTKVNVVLATLQLEIQFKATTGKS